MFLQFNRWKYALDGLLAPPKCVGCGASGVILCRWCLNRTPILERPACEICGRVTPGSGSELCADCALWPPAFVRARSIYQYAEPFRSLIVHMKYSPDFAAGQFLADIVSERVLEFGWPVDIGVPVPLSREKEKSRGFNQVDLFALPIAKHLNIGYSIGAMKRVKSTVSQVGLSHSQRKLNLRAAFAADSKKVRGCNVLLFDDVFTSGTTANECSQALLDAGAESVYVFTPARAAD